MRILFSKKQMNLPRCYRRWSIESTKQLMWVMKYEVECIKNIEWVKLYKNYMKSKQTNAFILLFPKMVDWINETMNGSDELWRWVHWNYEMSIVWKLYSFRRKFTYLAVPNYGQLNGQNNEYELLSMKVSALKLIT